MVNVPTAMLGLALVIRGVLPPTPVTFAPQAPELGRVLAIEGFEGRVVAGTDRGLFERSGGKWQPVAGSQDLPNPHVLSIAGDPATGDLWVGTIKGLTRVSAGRAQTWTQFSSGLANDVVYGLALQPPYVWAATAGGLSRFDPASGQWWIFNEKNTPMREIWNYSVAVAPDRVWAGIWGSGVLEYYVSEDRWKLYQDADGEAELVVMKDAGPIHPVTSAVATDGAVLWQSTYFGLSRYDGHRWKNYLSKDSGLPSNFVVTIKVHDHTLWACTDKGLASFDGKVWRTYLPGTHVLSVGFEGDTIYVGTYRGLQVAHVPTGAGSATGGGR